MTTNVHSLSISKGLTKDYLLKNIDRSSLPKMQIGSRKQNITLDHILDNLNEVNLTDLDIDEIYNAYVDMYNDLKNYHLILPHDIKMIKKGDVIKYSKTIDHISPGCVVIEIEYLNNRTKKDINHLNPMTEREFAQTDMIPKYFLVRGFGQDVRFWKLYPENYYFFQLTEKNKEKNKIMINLVKLAKSKLENKKTKKITGPD